MEDEDDRREAAIASRPSLQSNFKPAGVSQVQLAKFQELHRRRLQIKAKSTGKNKGKGVSGKTSKSHGKSLDSTGFAEEIVSKETDDASASILKGNTIKEQQENVAGHSGAIKRQKLHWGLDTKERWERKANM